MAIMGRPLMANNFSQIKMHAENGPVERTDPRYVDRREHNKMGKDEFLKLFTHQLSNQDPTNPLDSKQLGSDLAQYASLEQMTNINQKLDALKNNSATEGKFYAASFLGKSVTTAGTTIDYKGEGSTPIPFSLPMAASKAIVRIYDQNGQIVSQMEQDNLAAGEHRILWNGQSNDGAKAAAGTYTINIDAWDASMANFKGETKAMGIVTGVTFEQGQPVLILDGKKRVFLRDVESFQINSDNGVTGKAAAPAPTDNLRASNDRQ